MLAFVSWRPFEFFVFLATICLTLAKIHSARFHYAFPDLHQTDLPLGSL